MSGVGGKYQSKSCPLALEAKNVLWRPRGLIQIDPRLALMYGRLTASLGRFKPSWMEP